MTSASALLLAGCPAADDGDGTDANTDTGGPSTDAGATDAPTDGAGTRTATNPPGTASTSDTTGSSGETTTPERDETPTDEPATETPTETPADGPESSVDDATAVVEQFVRAASEGDRETAVSLLHPDHPFHPDNLGSDEEFSVDGGDGVERVETTVRNRNPTVEDARQVPAVEQLFEVSTLQDVLDESDAAILEVETAAEGETGQSVALAATVDGEWRLLWLAEKRPAESESELEVRVVDDVTVDGDTARVGFVDSPTADSVTVTATSAESEVSTSDLDGVRYLEVPVDSGGDEIRVRATLDGESGLVHRERTGSARVVTDVSFDFESDDAFGATARVDFSGIESEGTLTLASTVSEGESSVEPAANVTFLNVPVNDSGDEVVVTLTENGSTEELHRERQFP